MGDRARIQVKQGGNMASCSVYLHWWGDEAVKLLKKAVPRMREGDCDYSTARLIGELHATDDGNGGLGVLPPAKKDQDWDDFSHGDAGVDLVVERSGYDPCVKLVTLIRRDVRFYLFVRSADEARLVAAAFRDLATAIDGGDQEADALAGCRMIILETAAIAEH